MPYAVFIKFRVVLLGLGDVHFDILSRLLAEPAVRPTPGDRNGLPLRLKLTHTQS
jgi:hypothetical protein